MLFPSSIYNLSIKERLAMGNTIWVLSEDSDEDDWDHSLLLANEKSLDKLAEQISVKKLSEFDDHSILAEEYGGDIEPNYINPDDLEPVLGSLITAVRDGVADKLSGNKEIIEELEDCLEKVLNAKRHGKKVRMAIVP